MRFTACNTGISLLLHIKLQQLVALIRLARVPQLVEKIEDHFQPFHGEGPLQDGMIRGLLKHHDWMASIDLNDAYLEWQSEKDT